MLTILDPPNVAARTADTTDADNGFRTLAAGEMLFREGEARSHVYRVEKGSICLFKQRADGSQDVIEFAFPGDLVGLGYLDNHVSGAQATMETSLTLPATFGARSGAGEEPCDHVASYSGDRARGCVPQGDATLARSGRSRSSASPRCS